MKFVKKYRIPLTIVLILISIFAVIGVFRINLNPAFDILISKDSEYSENLSYMESHFASSDTLSIIIEYPGTKLTAGIFNEFIKIQAHLESIEGISNVTGPTSIIAAGSIPVSPSGGLQPESIKIFEQQLTEMGKLSPLTIKEGKVYGIYQVFLAYPMLRVLWDSTKFVLRVLCFINTRQNMLAFQRRQHQILVRRCIS